MIRTLYYDTAITGRFHYKEPNDSRAQPHLCRLALLIEDGDEELATHSMLIKPLERWTFDPEAINAHHITPELARERGIALADAWSLFTSELEKADVLVAYGDDHHWQVMQTVAKHDLDTTLDLPARTRQVCAMRRCAGIVRVKDPTGRRPFLYPRFNKAYDFFIKERPPLILDPAEFGAWFVRTLRDIWHGTQQHKPNLRSHKA
jgi:hypothetical protein